MTRIEGGLRARIVNRVRLLTLWLCVLCAGTIHHELGNLTALMYLGLSNNRLTGNAGIDGTNGFNRLTIVVHQDFHRKSQTF